MSRYYLDYNATAPVRPQVAAAVTSGLHAGNPSSVHDEGRRARAVMDDARRRLARLFNARPEGVIFTSGGTEACNLALHLRAAPAGPVRRILIGKTEHAAVLKAAQAIGIQNELPAVQVLPVHPDGTLDMAALEVALQDATPTLVCVMLANNETGVLHPVADIAAKLRAHGSVLFCDAVQAAGKIAIDMQALGCDAISVSAHKLGGPMGVGALIVRNGLVVSPLLLGGGQELGRRGGSENIAGILGFAAAAEMAHQELVDFAGLGAWRDAMEAALKESQPQVEIFGAQAPRLANTSCFGLAGLNSETLVMALDLAGIAVSAGAACSSGKVSRSHVLAAMQTRGQTEGQVGENADGALRVSFGWQSQADDWHRLIEIWSDLAAKADQLAAE